MISVNVPKKSNIDLAQLNIHGLVNGTSFAVNLICNTPLPGFHEIPSALSIDVSSKSKMNNIKDT